VNERAGGCEPPGSRDRTGARGPGVPDQARGVTTGLPGRIFLLAIAVCITSGVAWGYDRAPASRTGVRTASARTHQEPPCASEEHHRFDFWIGDWSVAQANGTPAGTNHIRSILDGCVVAEEYSTPEGYAGRSFSTYDARRGVWHQTWVDTANQLFTLEGGWRDTAMVLEGVRIGRDGSPVQNRITWAPVGERDVRQLWEISRDDGETWAVFFDGRYHRMR